MIKFAICDDSILFRTKLEQFIEKYCADNKTPYDIKSFESGEELLKAYENESSPFNIVFLDIYMHKMDGIATAKNIRYNDLDCLLIFITSSEQHALSAFQVYAFNYLVKPVDDNKLNDILSKALENISEIHTKKLVLKSGSKTFLIKPNDIIMAESENRKIHVHTKSNGIIRIYKKLDDFEKEIFDNQFLRCHKSYLINMNHVLSIDTGIFLLSDNNIAKIRQSDFMAMKTKYYSFLSKK